MILIINLCKEKLHYYEFVKPIEDILKNKKIGFFTKNYKKISADDLKEAEKIIICGTSLKDNEFLEDINKFEWLKNFKNSWQELDILNHEIVHYRQYQFSDKQIINENEFEAYFEESVFRSIRRLLVKNL